MNPDPESGTRLRAGLAAALLTLALPAAAADLADAITTAATALQPLAGDALAVPVCTLTLAGRAMPLLQLTERAADGKPQRRSLLLDDALALRGRLDHGSGAVQRCSGDRLVIRGSVEIDGRRLDGPVLRITADAQVQADATDPNQLAIAGREPPASGRPAAVVQAARAQGFDALRRAAVAPRGQTLAAWQPVCVLEAGSVRVPVLGWLALTLPKAAAGDYVPPARGSSGLLLTDASGAPLAQLDVPPGAVTACHGAVLQLAQPLYGGDCKARGWRCSGEEGDVVELLPGRREFGLGRSGR
ncbi:hypothetical protein [Plasticicumulans sp.]|uniref:hypothetical protein n=1 Tax=Plasticicumulans sp. TaxID=2307179 RepID=UPI002CBA537E|nr:hypothetical protein [Plasticicumulans sp.]HNM44719.1 hypothetical protein [Plasticicumulans sp.]